MSWEEYIPSEISDLYEIHDFRHASAIFVNEFPDQFEEICSVLKSFRFSLEDIQKAGGNESAIPKKFSELLRPKNWIEQKLRAKLVVDDDVLSVDTHKIDYLKGRIAFDLEWNSKDQTFDRDLYAFRAFFEYNKISLGILVTRSNELDTWFNSLGSYVDKYGTQRLYKSKYGASTTHMGKLIPRIRANRNGGCPILVFGITTKLITERP